jgi:hypothetical protein
MYAQCRPKHGILVHPNRVKMKAASQAQPSATTATVHNAAFDGPADTFDEHPAFAPPNMRADAMAANRGGGCCTVM